MTPNVAMVEDDVEIRKTLSFFLDACEEIGKVDEFGSVEAIMDAVEKGFVPDVVLMNQFEWFCFCKFFYYSFK